MDLAFIMAALFCLLGVLFLIEEEAHEEARARLRGGDGKALPHPPWPAPPALAANDDQPAGRPTLVHPARFVYHTRGEDVVTMGDRPR